MNINAHWIHQRLVVDTVLSFARRALPDSALSQWPDGPTPYPLAYEISDAVPSAYGDRAFHVRVALELRAVRDHGQLGGHARPTCDRVARRRVPRRRVPRAGGRGLVSALQLAIVLAPTALQLLWLRRLGATCGRARQVARMVALGAASAAVAGAVGTLAQGLLGLALAEGTAAWHAARCVLCVALVEELCKLCAARRGPNASPWT